MTTRDAVLAAKTPRDALLVLADAIDALSSAAASSPWETWGDEPVKEWDDSAAHVEAARALASGDAERANQKLSGVKIELKGDTAEVIIPPVSEERRAARRQLEQSRLKLAEAHPEIFGPEEDWTEVYAKGGPLWLYNIPNGRDLVMEYGTDVRRAMVADVEQDDPATANDMGRDLLKQASIQPNDEGVGAMHVSNL